MTLRLTRLLMGLGGAFAVGAVGLAQPAAGSWGLPQLMGSLARVRAASATFAERKTIQVLRTPLLASGTLLYAAPDYMDKVTKAPVPEDFVLDHGNITLSGGPDHQTHSFSLATAPQIGGLVEGIRATLAGDLPALQRYYAVQLTGTAANWQLLLKPEDPALGHFIKWMLIRGSENRLNTIDTASPDGDHAEMGIDETITNAR